MRGSGIETALCFSALALVQGQQKATACRILGSITWASTIGRTSSCPYFLFFFFGIVRVQFFPSKLPNTENLSLSLALPLSLWQEAKKNKQNETNKTKKVGTQLRSFSRTSRYRSLLPSHQQGERGTQQRRQQYPSATKCDAKKGRANVGGAANTERRQG